MEKLLSASFAALACLAAAPSYAMAPRDCTNQQGRTLEQIESHLGPGQLNAATAPTKYMEAMETYTFGNHRTGTCTVIIRRGRADFVTYYRF
jgi:hypothetical protein